MYIYTWARGPQIRIFDLGPNFVDICLYLTQTAYRLNDLLENTILVSNDNIQDIEGKYLSPGT